MPRFFDKKTGTLYDVKDGVDKEMKGVTPVIEPANNGLPGSTKIRRENATKDASTLPLFFSTTDNTLLSGNFDPYDKTNEDLVKVVNTVSSNYRPPV